MGVDLRVEATTSPNVHLVAAILDARSPVVPARCGMVPLRQGEGQYAAEESHIEDRSHPRHGGPVRVALTGGAALAGSPNGSASQRPVFYDGGQVTVNMFEVPASALLDSNRSINTIYATNDLDEEQDLLSVIDAIQGDGFNPLWHQVLIASQPGIHAPPVLL